MRVARILIVAALLLIVAVGVVATLALRHQTRLVRMVLAQINSRTGFDIKINKSRLAFHEHLVLILVQPRVFSKGREIARARDIRAVIGYHSLIYTSGLPLHAIEIDSPQVELPSGFANTSFRQPDRQTVGALSRHLDSISSVAQRIDINNATLVDGNQNRVMSALFVSARPEHRRLGKWPWFITFDGLWNRQPLAGMHVAGDILLRTVAKEGESGGGRLWFSNLVLHQIHLARASLSGNLNGNTKFTLGEDGRMQGNADFDLQQIMLAGKAFAQPLRLGDYSLSAAYDASNKSIKLSDLILQQAHKQILAGSCTIGMPYEASRTAAFKLSGLDVTADTVKRLTKALARAPKWLVGVANALESGRATVEELDLAPTQPVAEWTMSAIDRSLRLRTTVTDLGFTTPSNLALPAVSHFDAAIDFGSGSLELSQGSGQVGNSSIRDLAFVGDFRDFPRRLPYRLDARGDADLSQLYATVSRLAKGFDNQKIESISGIANFRLQAFGNLVNFEWSQPSNYLLRLGTDNTQLKISGAPTEIAITDGRVTLQPGYVQIANLEIAPVAPEHGRIVLNGGISLSPGPAVLRDVTAKLHAMQLSRWLPLIVPPKSVSASGAVDGSLAANGPLANQGLIITGGLTVTGAQLTLGFLRSPIIAGTATVGFDGSGAKVTIPTGEFEGSPVNLQISVADFHHPMVRLDGTAQSLDLEAIKFIRLPWMPKTPPAFFSVPIEGEIEANQAIFGKLVMSNAKGGFVHNAKGWQLNNFAATALGGRIHLNLSGDTRSTWFHIVGNVTGLDAGPLMMLSGDRKSAPITGKLDTTADLWAATGSHFFDTLAGTVSIKVHNGIVNRFTLLTRILSLIDLKTWLTAHIPNPLVAGIPFSTVTADFKGKGGNFYTNNLRLRGPVMDISADGNIDFGSSTMDMQVGLVPFNTVNWLMNKIPLIGQHIAAGSQGLLAAYFQVRGPVNNPAITPKPITSVAEFLAKTLSLPINIIAPDTINP